MKELEARLTELKSYKKKLEYESPYLKTYKRTKLNSESLHKEQQKIDIFFPPKPSNTQRKPEEKLPDKDKSLEYHKGKKIGIIK